MHDPVDTRSLIRTIWDRRVVHDATYTTKDNLFRRPII